MSKQNDKILAMLDAIESVLRARQELREMSENYQGEDFGYFHASEIDTLAETERHFTQAFAAAVREVKP